MKAHQKYSSLAFVALFTYSFQQGAIAGGCPAGSSTIFSCAVVKSGKQVDLCDAKQTIIYKFGKQAAEPDINLSVSRDQVTTDQWDGTTRYVYNSVSVPNKDTTYEVFSNIDKDPKSTLSEAGVKVNIKGKNVATVFCEKVAVDNLEGVKLRANRSANDGVAAAPATIKEKASPSSPAQVVLRSDSSSQVARIEEAKNAVWVNENGIRKNTCMHGLRAYETLFIQAENGNIKIANQLKGIPHKDWNSNVVTKVFALGGINDLDLKLIQAGDEIAYVSAKAVGKEDQWIEKGTGYFDTCKKRLIGD